MNRRISFFTCLCLWWSVQVLSQEVSFGEAQRVAENFFQSQIPQKLQMPQKAELPEDTEIPTMYAFSFADNWIIVSGDKRIRPILAYGEDGGPFPAIEDMPPGMSEMLEWYKAQIEDLRMGNVIGDYDSIWDEYLDENNSDLGSRVVIVEPLLTRNGNENVWGQSGNNNGYDIAKSYNKYCPPRHDNSQDCDHTIVGCVAVATSQVMWYWQWPYTAIVKDDNGNELLRNYDWNEIPYRLTSGSTTAQADMTANLLHDVGVAVHMNYGCSSSGASPSYIAAALRNVFGYNADNLKSRSAYTNAQWLQMIKTELNNLSPVLYGGQGSSGGHRFVIDGYDSDDYFHINYGWKGYGNGYFSLDSITYNNSQSMVMNIRPQYPSCTPLTILSTEVWNTHFTVQNGGAISIENRTITNGMHGTILSGESITLEEGFSVEAGAEVYIAIKDMHCDEEQQNVSFSILSRHTQAPSARITPREEPKASKFFRNGQMVIQYGDNVYDAMGIRIQ